MADGPERQPENPDQPVDTFEAKAERLSPEKRRQIGRMLLPHPDIIPVLIEAFGEDYYPTDYLRSLYEDRDGWASEQLYDFKRLLDRMAPYCFPDKVGLFNTQEENDAFQRLVEQELRDEAAAEAAAGEEDNLD